MEQGILDRGWGDGLMMGGRDDCLFVCVVVIVTWWVSSFNFPGM